MEKTRILVVEDEGASARLIEMTLKSLGYAVPAVIPSGEEAINKAGEVHPDLVLMDIYLKGDMDGVQAAEEICARYNIPVVYLTAYADNDTLQRAKITEPYGYILKPFQKRELHASIEVALYKHKLDSKLKEREQALEKLTAELKTNNEHLQREITERKRAEDALRESEEKYKSLVKNVKLGVFRSMPEPTGRFLEVNPAMEEITGYSREELLQMNVSDLYVHPEERRAVLEVIASTTGKATRELRFRKKDGTEIVVSDTKVAIRDDTDNIQYFDGILEDITERKQAQQAQERLNQQLQAKVSELEALSYGIAHDLRSPMLSIEGFSRLLRADIQNQKMERVQEDIQLLESGVSKMQQFINRTLEYSRAGHLVKRTKNVPFGKVVEEVITEFAEQVRSIGATVSLAETFPRVCVDRMRIRQVLTNLIQNSINYRDKTMPLKIEIGYWLSGDEVVFFVRDNGVGINASETEKVFGLFYRGTTDGEGSGAGLAIVKRIIEAHGGRIWAESQSGEGTTMCFALPRQSSTKTGDNNEKN